MENYVKINWHKNKDVSEHNKNEIKNNNSIILYIMKYKFVVKLWIFRNNNKNKYKN